MALFWDPDNPKELFNYRCEYVKGEDGVRRLRFIPIPVPTKENGRGAPSRSEAVPARQAPSKSLNCLKPMWRL